MIKIDIGIVADWYACSDGHIWDNKKNRFIKEFITRDGYFLVSKSSKATGQKRFLVSRIICRAFHGDPPNESYTVDHIDYNKINNTPENLRWQTTKENRPRPKHGTGLQKMTPELLSVIRSQYKPWHRESGATALARKYGFSPSYIQSVIQGRKLSHIQ